MALIKCSECGQEMSDTAITCPHCGNSHTPVGKRDLRRRKAVGTLGLLVYSTCSVVIIALWFVLGFKTIGWIFAIILVLVWLRWIHFIRKSR